MLITKIQYCTVVALYMCRHTVTLPTNNILYNFTKDNITKVYKNTVILLMGFSKLVFLLVVVHSVMECYGTHDMCRGTLEKMQCLNSTRTVRT